MSTSANQQEDFEGLPNIAERRIWEFWSRSGLGDLTYGAAQFTLIADEDADLPQFLGSTLRGSLGHALRKIACVPMCRDPKTCIIRERCAYGYCFETHLPVGSQVLRGLEHIPHPLVLEPPLNGGLYKKGEPLKFNLLLIGKALKLFPYFVAAIDKMAKNGLGKERRTFSLVEVLAITDKSRQANEHCENEILWSKSLEKIHPLKEEKLKFDNLGDCDCVTVNFVTPLRLLKNGKLLYQISFRELLRSLLARISSLLYFHCSSEMKLDFRQVLETAGSVETSRSSLRFQKLSRWSSRQNTKVGLDGMVGEITFKGKKLPLFMPLLISGEILHVGKGTIFGLGKYRLSNNGGGSNDSIQHSEL